MLTLVATPIGRTDEITVRSLELLKDADVVICESTKEASRLLKIHNIKAKRYEVLNEHSDAADVEALLKICRELNAVLVSDCGTPSFCDPGFQLVKLCRRAGIPVQSSLGASSLMGLLSLSSEKIESFFFRGFLPAENTAREKEWLLIKKNNGAFILMDTPYRLQKMIQECQLHLFDRRLLLVINLSQPDEAVIEGSPDQLRKELQAEKAEFMILVYPRS